MPINRRITKFIALPLAAAAVAAPAAIAVQPVGVAGPAIDAPSVGAHVDPGRLCTTVSERGYPNALPAILPPPPCSAVVAIRQEEAFEGREFWYDPPATARYSNAEMNAYAGESK